jgi:hypothetical protein
VKEICGRRPTHLDRTGGWVGQLSTPLSDFFRSLMPVYASACLPHPSRHNNQQQRSGEAAGLAPRESASGSGFIGVLAPAAPGLRGRA